MIPEIFFASSNNYKTEELVELGKAAGITVRQVTLDKVHEIQTPDIDALVRDKTLQAFREARLPILVDHAGLYIDCLGGMPGGLTQLFWDTLEGKICEIVKHLGPKGATAACTLGFCNGKRLHVYKGETRGCIADVPRGARTFQWDVIFVPDGQTRTFAEMAIAEKNAISQRKAAFDQLAKDLKEGRI